MIKKRLKLIILLTAIPAVALFGANPRAEDGFLFFIVILGFLGLILGILYLVETIRKLIRRFLDEYFTFF